MMNLILVWIFLVVIVGVISFLSVRFWKMKLPPSKPYKLSGWDELIIRSAPYSVGVSSEVFEKKSFVEYVQGIFPEHGNDDQEDRDVSLKYMYGSGTAPLLRIEQKSCDKDLEVLLVTRVEHIASDALLHTDQDLPALVETFFPTQVLDMTAKGNGGGDTLSFNSWVYVRLVKRHIVSVYPLYSFDLTLPAQCSKEKILEETMRHQVLIRTFERKEDSFLVTLRTNGKTFTYDCAGVSEPDIELEP
jgi:hypothetical protein